MNNNYIIKNVIKIILLCFCPAILLKIKQKYFRKFSSFFKEEKKNKRKPTFGKRLWALKNGFLSDKVLLYGLTKNNLHSYIPDLSYLSAHPINGPYSSLIDSKMNLFFTLGNFSDILPEYYYLITQNEIISLSASCDKRSIYNFNSILNLCKTKGKLVIKANASQYGEAFYLLKYDGENYLLNDKIINNMNNFPLNKFKDFIVTEYVHQHQSIEKLFSHTVNTIRIMTMRDYEQHNSFIAYAVQRIGRQRSIPVDNWHAGGIISNVNIETGELGGCVYISDDFHIQRTDKHPETNYIIKGCIIPNWKDIKEKIVNMANELAMIPYMGWDIVVTKKGFKVIEINSLPGLGIVQINDQILKEQKIYKFYKMHIKQLYK